MLEKSIVYINSNEELDQFVSTDKPYILYFGLKGCGVCDDVFPLLLDLIKDYDIQIAKIDIGEQKRIAGQHLIFTPPTISIFYEGIEVLRESRFVDFNNIKRLLDNIF